MIKMTEEIEKNFSIFPKCPKCQTGDLLPFSFREDVFDQWKCSNPDCNYTIKKTKNH